MKTSSWTNYQEGRKERRKDYDAAEKGYHTQLRRPDLKRCYAVQFCRDAGYANEQAQGDAINLTKVEERISHRYII